MAIMDKWTYTVAEAAARIGISRGLAFEKVRTGELPAIKLGKRWLIPKAALRKMFGVAESEGEVQNESQQPTDEG